jgi:two-component system phosphate regulon response regulator PhoB
MSGIELATRLRDDPRTTETPIIMLSARGYLAPAEELAKTRILEQVPKPFSPKKLAKLIAEVLERERPHRTDRGLRREAA